MTIGKEQTIISTAKVVFAVAVSLIAFIASIIGVGIYLGTLQSVNLEQTKQIDSINIDLKAVATKDDLKVFKEDIKGMLQTYTSQITKMNK
jgi:predicted methyltransferase MtxX (methanogen marker protein 4)